MTTTTKGPCIVAEDTHGTENPADAARAGEGDRGGNKVSIGKKRQSSKNCCWERSNGEQETMGGEIKTSKKSCTKIYNIRRAKIYANNANTCERENSEIK